MAGDTPPTVPPTVDYAPLEDYEFDPLDELEPGNDFVDAALTRAGEFVLDVIETVQAHPVLTASVMAAGLGLLGGLVAAALVIAVSELVTRGTERGRALARALGATLGRLRDREVLVLALASGVGEEALFRGALQPEVGLAVASVLFAAAHFVPRRELMAWSAFALGAGLLLGALYDVTGNLVAPVVAHAVVNGVNLRRLSRDFGSAPIPP